MILSKPISSINNSHTWNYTDFMEFDQRIDIIFFKEINFLLENEKPLEDRIINSIIQFCRHKEDKIIIKN